MVESKPAGRTERYEGGGGRGFTRGFRRSRRGQRPAVETTTLINAVQMQKTGDLSATVDIAEKINPKNGESAREYAERLQTKMQRKIMVAEDLAEANLDFDKRCAQALASLI